MIARFDELLNVVKTDLKGVVPYSENITSKVLLLSNRNKRTLGKCTKNRENTQFTISLNPKLENMSEQLIKDVLAHEIIHTAKGCFNHGYNFKNYMYRVNYSCKNYNVETKTKSKEWEENKQYKYKLTCKKCGEVIYRNKINREWAKLGLYSHGRCGGDLIIEQLY